jgi:hypothetical protein
MARRFSCGKVTPSACVPWTGGDLSFLADDAQPDCDSSINDIVALIDTAITNIQTAIDLTSQNNQCLSSVPTDVDVKGLFQIHTNTICGLSASLATLQETVAAWNVSTQLITIDLGCLSSAAAPCQQGSNTYQLISILSLFASEICTIKAYLGI